MLQAERAAANLIETIEQRSQSSVTRYARMGFPRFVPGPFSPQCKR